MMRSAVDLGQTWLLFSKLCLNCFHQRDIELRCGLIQFKLPNQTSMEQVEQLKTLLAVTKQAPSDKMDQDFYCFMMKAKETLGETNYHMAQFYYEYANYILQKIEANMDIFNEQAMPNNADEPNQSIIENVAEEYDSESGEQLDNPEEVKQGQENQEGEEPCELPAQPQITQGDLVENGAENAAAEGNEDSDDREICFSNLALAQDLFEKELEQIKEGKSTTNTNEVLDGLKRAITRLADLHTLEEEYTEAIKLYNKVIDQEAEREGFQCSRFISQLYYLIGNSLLYQNGVDCETKSIQEYIKAVNILLGFLSITLQYDISSFVVPTQENVKVDRFSYMCLAGDTDEIKDVKEIIECILDKIEDTHSQLTMKDVYLAERQTITVSASQREQFKPVEQTAKVVHLGNFGNRRKIPEEVKSTPVPSESLLKETQNLSKEGKEGKEDSASNFKKQGQA